MAYGPGGVLFYTSYNDNGWGQIQPGSSSPSKVDPLPASITPTVGSLGFDDAGHMKVTSFLGNSWYDTTLSPDGSGTFNMTVNGPGIDLGLNLTRKASAMFPPAHRSSPARALDRRCWGGPKHAYNVDANNDPITSSARVFMIWRIWAASPSSPLTGDLLDDYHGNGKAMKSRLHRSA